MTGHSKSRDRVHLEDTADISATLDVLLQDTERMLHEYAPIDEEASYIDRLRAALDEASDDATALLRLLARKQGISV
jgi:hypothetical protein